MKLLEERSWWCFLFLFLGWWLPFDDIVWRTQSIPVFWLCCDTTARIEPHNYHEWVDASITRVRHRTLIWIDEKWVWCTPSPAQQSHSMKYKVNITSLRMKLKLFSWSNRSLTVNLRFSARILILSLMRSVYFLKFTSTSSSMAPTII